MINKKKYATQGFSPVTMIFIHKFHRWYKCLKINEIIVVMTNGMTNTEIIEDTSFLSLNKYISGVLFPVSQIEKPSFWALCMFHRLERWCVVIGVTTGKNQDLYKLWWNHNDTVTFLIFEKCNFSYQHQTLERK